MVNLHILRAHRAHTPVVIHYYHRGIMIVPRCTNTVNIFSTLLPQRNLVEVSGDAYVSRPEARLGRKCSTHFNTDQRSRTAGLTAVEHDSESDHTFANPNGA